MGALHYIDEVRIQREILEAFPSRHSNFLSGAVRFTPNQITPDPFCCLSTLALPATVWMLDVSAPIIRPVGGERQLKLLFLF
jgi:hypothetical protein